LAVVFVKFFVGCHQPSDAQHFERAFISINRLRERKSPFKARHWVLDSGAFSEISTHGHYRSTVEQLFRLRAWKSEAMEVLRRWDDVAAKVDVPWGEFKSDYVGREIDRLQARVAELEAIPPRPAFLPWAKLDPSDVGVIVKTEAGWAYIGAKPPTPADWGSDAWEHFKNIGPMEPPGGTP
jgi:hypothetical protein